MQQKSYKLISELKMSADFKAKAIDMGIKSLEDVLDMDINMLKKHPKFTYRWYTDLLNVLKSENLLDKFQEKLSH